MATRPYHHGNLREALIESALKLLAEDGIRNLTLRNVAREAGVAPSAMYRHYESKDALLAGVAENGFAKLIAMGERIVRNKGNNPLALYTAMSRTYVGFALENPDQLRLMFSSYIEDRGRYPELAEIANQSFQQFADGIQLCQEKGLIDRDLEPRIVALALWSMYHGLSMLILEQQVAELPPQKKSRALAQALGKLVLDGLGKKN